MCFVRAVNQIMVDDACMHTLSLSVLRHAASPHSECNLRAKIECFRVLRGKKASVDVFQVKWRCISK